MYVENSSKLIQQILDSLSDLKMSFDDIEFVSKSLNDFFVWLQKNNLEPNQVSVDLYLEKFFDKRPKTRNSLNSRKTKTALDLMLEFIEFKTISLSKKLAVYHIECDMYELLSKFLTYNFKVKALSADTIANRKHFIPYFISFLHVNNIELNDINSTVVVDFFTFHNYSKPQKNVNATMLRQWFKWLYKHNYTKQDKSCFVPKSTYYPGHAPDRFTNDELCKLISIAQQDVSLVGLRTYAILLILVTTGMRARDVVNLKFENFDWDQRLINFTASKNSFALSFTLYPSVGNAVIRYLRESEASHQNSDYIFLTHSRSANKANLSSASVYDAICNLCRKANLKEHNRHGYGPHKIRATIASEAIEKGVSIFNVTKLLGHNHPESTSSYIKLSVDNLRACCLDIVPLKSHFYDMLLNKQKESNNE